MYIFPYAESLRRIGEKIAVIPEQRKIKTVVINVRVDIVAVNLLRAVKRPQFQKTPAAFKRIEGGPFSDVGFYEPVFDFICSDNLISTGTDGKQVFEFEPEEVVPAVTFDKVILV